MSVSDVIVASISAKSAFCSPSDKLAIVLCCENSREIEELATDTHVRSIIDAIGMDPRYSIVVLVASKDTVVDRSQAASRLFHNKPSPLTREAERAVAILSQIPGVGIPIVAFTSDMVHPGKQHRNRSECVSDFMQIISTQHYCAIPMFVSRSKHPSIEEVILGNNLVTRVNLSPPPRLLDQDLDDELESSPSFPSFSLEALHPPHPANPETASPLRVSVVPVEPPAEIARRSET